MQQNPKLTKLLVKRLLKKHGVDQVEVTLTEEERKELREVIEDIQGKVEQFLQEFQTDQNKDVKKKEEKN
ncbi:hypothetical protein ACFPTR_08480 [Aliibacillus thermotolerans]|uniref:Spore coat protein n=1 Tax=Aliibacillus thermotolerans TaxID=1834418 RepID=A0ABW0U7Z2_9BACI|nr:hypothetical protein [Aliibacillus thermotolerans]MDA3129360.1 hypothetical protein [Aliibacillus thermotolerans]